MNDSLESSRVLKSFRVKKGLTLEQASSLVGWHFNTYSRRENNPLNYPIDELFLMVEVLGGDFDEFFNALTQDFKSYKTVLNK